MGKEIPASYFTGLKTGECVKVGDDIEIRYCKEKGASGLVQIKAPRHVPIEKVKGE